MYLVAIYDGDGQTWTKTQTYVDAEIVTQKDRKRTDRQRQRRKVPETEKAACNLSKHNDSDQGQTGRRTKTDNMPDRSTAADTGEFPEEGDKEIYASKRLKKGEGRHDLNNRR